MVTHDVPINWRLAHRGLIEPRANLDFNILSAIRHDTTLNVFLPLHPMLPVLAIRNWLHDDGNNQFGYRIFGRYHFALSQSLFIGLLIEFFDNADACLFRLSWN